jgi:ATP-binding cassette subfamily C protein
VCKADYALQNCEYRKITQHCSAGTSGAQPPQGQPYVASLVTITPRQAVLTLGLMMCLSLTEGVGLVLLIPLLHLVGLDVAQGSLGRITQLFFSGFTAIGVRPTLLTVLGFYALITNVQGLLSRWQTTASLTLQHDFVAVLLPA